MKAAATTTPVTSSQWTSSATARAFRCWSFRRTRTGGQVDHVYCDHVSIIKFIERNWSLPDHGPQPRQPAKPESVEEQSVCADQQPGD